MRTITKLILHCSATPDGRDVTVDDIRRWHRQRGYADIGYHFIIYRDGSIHPGRAVERIGAHCKGHNAHSIGICYIGGLSKDGKTAADTRMPAQKSAIVTVLKQLHARFPNATIHGHNEFAPKACPSFNVKQEYNSLFS